MKGNERYRKGYLAGLAGVILVAVCCFTPVLVLLAGAVGLSAFTPYLDFVLFPALGVFLLIAILSYRKWKISCECSTETPNHGNTGEK
ncbi:MAG: mercury resistance system transport protein MerF [Deltaproteobacteria bacterium]|nr:mercury resistance system transport protein MerF [Deltaproteobacteria bacterium]